MPQANEHKPNGSPAGARATSWHKWLGVGVLVCAALVRVVCFAQTSDVPTSQHLIGDAKGYYEWAQRIAAGDWIGSEPFYQAPLYPYLMAIRFKILGDEVLKLRAVQWVAGVWGTLFLYWAASRLFGRREAFVAGLMLALYAPAIFFDVIVQKAWLGCLLLCALMILLARTADVRKLRACVLVGVVLGLMILTRENALVWLPVIALWVWAVWKGESSGVRLRAVGAYFIGLCIVLAPVAVRNAKVGGEWSLSTFQAGPNFYIGNHAGADGRYQPLVRGHESPAFERHDATVLAEAAMGRSLSAREVSSYWFGRAADDMREDPAGWLALLGKKMLMVWNRYEVSDGESLSVYAESSTVLRVLGGVWHFGVLCPLAFVGFVATWSSRRRLWVYYVLIATMAGSVAIFYVLARYRFPLVPLLIPFAAAGCVRTWDGFRSVGWRSLPRPAVVALLVAVVVNLPLHDERRLDAMARMNAGVALASSGDLEGAAPYFRSAVEVHPGSAEAHNNLAQLLALQGNFSGAVEEYRAALSLVPGLGGVDYNLAVALERVGRVDEAMSHFSRALELDPLNADAWLAVERLRQR